MKIEVQIDNQHYTVEIDDIHARPVIAWVQGERFEVWPEDTGSTQTGQAAMPVVSVPDVTPVAKAPEVLADGGRELTSPLPGVIVAVLVKPGDAVIRGQELCTLEAMKMKNAIRSDRDGVIAQVNINAGDSVKHNQPMFTFQD